MIQILLLTSLANTTPKDSPLSIIFRQIASLEHQAVVKHISNVDCLNISKSITFEEITYAIKSCKPLKSPRPNDLHPIFFQKNWHIIITQVFDIWSSIFETGIIPQVLN